MLVAAPTILPPVVSKIPLKSAVPEKVDSPETFKLSSSVSPSISTLPLRSTVLKVATPETFKFVDVTRPANFPSLHL